ncbi:phosphonoacetaldehyde reductase [Microbulbifer sp. ALW1]|uniref:phosphonoacetaldehyde reductase n=1 Tax=Microbulbifer sp. (strain ALW1) TaxID=1516059 RepID=UPI00135BDA27|nr:phosphonoacetaldehyde reductase [Microbulbifer sp. ALW1]
MWLYRNPVEIIAGEDALNSLARLVANRRYAVLTYDAPIFGQYLERVAAAVGYGPVAVVTNIDENPDITGLQCLIDKISGLVERPELLVALGGGSVIDTCKVISGCVGQGVPLRNLLASKDAIENPIDYVSIPTTAGTGSEVTCWATVWDPDNGVKHSLSDPALYGRAALLDPTLTLSLPESITVSTALDALSHALESLWNVNRNPVSSLFAIRAAQLVLVALPEAIESPSNYQAREALLQASLFAGMAFSNTKTSIAHNISYAVTLEKGLPHGVACSFTLPMIIRAIEPGTTLAGDIEMIFDCDYLQAADRLEDFFRDVGVETNPAAYGYDVFQWTELVAKASSGDRGRNFNGDIFKLTSLFREDFMQRGDALCQP